MPYFYEITFNDNDNDNDNDNIIENIGFIIIWTLLLFYIFISAFLFQIKITQISRVVIVGKLIDLSHKFIVFFFCLFQMFLGL